MGGFVRKIFAPSPPAYTPPPAPKPAPAVKAAPVKPAPDESVLAPEAEAPKEIQESIKKKKKGRYGTLLTGSEGALGDPDLEKKSLLGS